MYTVGYVTMPDRCYDRADNYGTQNQNYEKDIRYVHQYSKWLLRPIGIAPLIYNRAGTLERVVSAILVIASLSLICFVLIPFGHYTLFKEKDVKAKIKHIGPLIFTVSSMIKYYYLSVKGSAFGRCIDHMERDWKMIQDPRHRDIMMKNVDFGRSLIFLFGSSLYTGGLTYHAILPLLSTVKINETFTVRSHCYPGYDALFNVQATPVYEIVYCAHCIYVLITCSITIVVYSLATGFVNHACGRMQILTSRLSDLIKEAGEKDAEGKTRLATIVKDHAEIIRFSRNVDDALGEICLLEMVECTSLICLTAYDCLTEWADNDAVAMLTYCTISATFIFNIFTFCYIGELLFEQGKRIGAASYEIEWYDLPHKSARDIILLIAISKSPPKLTAGKMCDLSLNTFGAVLKSSAVYFNLVKTVTEW